MKVPHFSHVYQLIPYPGSKARIGPILRSLIPPKIKTIYSPFMGSATFEIYIAKNGIDVFAYDKLHHVVNLFQRIQEDKTKVYKLIKNMMPCKKEQWKEYVRSLSLDFAKLDKYDAAAMTYVVQQYSMSGIARGRYNDHHEWIANGHIDNSKRLQISLLCNKIKRAHMPQNIQFAVADYRDVLKIQRTDNAMLYLDPPYDIKYYLYGLNLNGKETFNHVELSNLLKQQSNWILSYGDTKQIRELYADYKTLEYSSPYSMSGFGRTKKGKELVILSHDIADYWNDHGILAFNEGE